MNNTLCLIFTKYQYQQPKHFKKHEIPVVYELKTLQTLLENLFDMCCDKLLITPLNGILFPIIIREKKTV